MQLFCFGFGYVARHLARSLPDVWQVVGTVRSPERQQELREQGYHAFCYGDGLAFSEGAKLALTSSSHVLVSIPPGAEGHDAALAIMQELGDTGTISWIGYLSTTGVYGDWQGEWVDEDTPPRPVDERSQNRLQAERGWQAFGQDRNLPVPIFRLAGIYGPRRNPLLSLKAGSARRIDKPGHFISRIHVDDIVQVLRASMGNPQMGAVYNVCDDLPSESREPVEFAAELLQMEPPPLMPCDEAALPPLARSFYAANKRVRNARIKDELGVQLHYLSYREGLRALWQEMLK